MTVLVVDDSRTMRRMLTAMIASCGVEVLHACDGREGLEMLDRCEISAVFTDIHMPEMDGIELVREIRSRPHWERIGVCVVSSDTAPGQIARALLAGADDYLMKPVHHDDVVALVRRYLHLDV